MSAIYIPHIVFRKGYWRVYWRNTVFGTVAPSDTSHAPAVRRRSPDAVKAHSFVCRLNQQRLQA